MSNGPKDWVKLAQTAAAQNKKVLAVEGDTDDAVLIPWLEKRLGPTWANQIYLAKAKNRQSILDGLRWLKANNDPAKDAIFGLADRDEWDGAEIAALQAELPTLLVNQARHSLESHFCDPDEIVAILQHRDNVTGLNVFGPHLPAFQQQLEQARPSYVAHWALARIIQRANEQIRHDAQYPIFFRDTCPLPSDANIELKLKQWAAIIEPQKLIAEFQKLRIDSLARSVQEQFRSCIEPKLFVGNVVLEGPSGLVRIKSQKKKEWMIELARWSPAMPTDLENVLNPVLV